MHASYQSLLTKLYKMNIMNPVKLDLANMIQLNNILQNPLSDIPVIHIAGTNGKGSVAYKLSASLSGLGIRTGLFTSPHISSFKERIQVNHAPLSDNDVINLLPEIFDLCEKHGIPATFFELTTALAFSNFRQSSCQAVVLETGLGGRLDATNIVTPVLSIITSIQLDHQNILGNTIDEIAVEKAGIMKSGVDVLVGPGCPTDLMKMQAILKGAIFHSIDDVLHPSERRYSSSILTESSGDIDDLNYDLSLAALRLLQRKGGVFSIIPSTTLVRSEKSNNYRAHSVEEEKNSMLLSSSSIQKPRLVQESLLRRPPCRFEVFKEVLVVPNIDGAADGAAADSVKRTVHILLDIAHNEDAMKALVKKVQMFYPNKPLRVVVGISADKKVTSCLLPLIDLVGRDTSLIHCVEAYHPRAMSRVELYRRIDELVSTPTRSMEDDRASSSDGTIRSVTRDAIHRAAAMCRDPMIEELDSSLREGGIDGADDDDDDGSRPHDLQDSDALVVVCGSAFIMAEVRAALSIIEPRDGDILSNEPQKGGSYRDMQDFFRIDKTTVSGSPNKKII